MRNSRDEMWKKSNKMADAQHARHLYSIQACQVTRIARVTHALDQFHTLTRTRQAISRNLRTGVDRVSADSLSQQQSETRLLGSSVIYTSGG